MLDGRQSFVVIAYLVPTIRLRRRGCQSRRLAENNGLGRALRDAGAG
jgi:hypothetical protein